MSALDVYGLTVVTSVVSEIPGLVSKIVHLDADIVYDQTSILLKAFPVRAVKTGMIGTLQQAQAIVQSLVESKMNSLHLVVDPVIVATAGSRLMKNDALDFLKAELYPKATLITPNMDEASVLLNSENLNSVISFKLQFY
jgi:hydroxymethylpyrimidine/phosphomethylpyrimidine kinase